MFDVVVVGKGLMGSAAFRYLSAELDKVVLVGPEEPENWQAVLDLADQYAGVYAAVGIPAFPPPGEGLIIEFDPKTEDGALTLKGEIINTTSGVREVPGLRVLITDASDQTLKEWSFVSDVRRLGPGETVAFTTQTDSVPAGAANVSILFTNSDDNP